MEETCNLRCLRGQAAQVTPGSEPCRYRWPTQVAHVKVPASTDDLLGQCFVFSCASQQSVGCWQRRTFLHRSQGKLQLPSLLHREVQLQRPAPQSLCVNDTLLQCITVYQYIISNSRLKVTWCNAAVSSSFPNAGLVFCIQANMIVT